MNDYMYDRSHDLDLTVAQTVRLYESAGRADSPLGDDATSRMLERKGLANAKPTIWPHVTEYRLNDHGAAAAGAIRTRVDAGDVTRMGSGERRMVAERPWMIPDRVRDTALIALLGDPLPTVRRRAAECLSDRDAPISADTAARLARHGDPRVRACRAVVRTAPIEAYAHETDPTVVAALVAEHRYDDMMVEGWLHSDDERVFNQALTTVGDERLERLLRRGVFPGACVHEWVKRKHPLEWDLVAHIIPTLDPNGYATYSIADHVIHVPDDMIRMLPRTFAYRIREAAEAQAEANRLMSVFADPHGDAARKAITEAEARA